MHRLVHGAPAYLPIQGYRRCLLQRVEDRWSDTNYYWFELRDYGKGPGGPPSVELDKPVAGAKRVYEANVTYYVYVFGFTVYRGQPLRKLVLDVRVGAYHGYDNTRANIAFIVTIPDALNTNNSFSYPYLCLEWSMHNLGIANGDCCYPLSGYISLLDPIDYNFSPANPSIAYNRLDELATAPEVVVIFGYKDAWSSNWRQWAAITRESMVGFCR